MRPLHLAVVGGCLVLGMFSHLRSAGAADDHVEVLATGQSGPSDVVVDDAHIYWTNRENGTLMRLPKSGGPATEYVPSQPRIGRLVLDDSHVYWTSGPNIRSKPKAGGPVVELATVETRGNRGPAGLAVHGNWVYWTMYFDAVGTIMRVKKTGGKPSTLASRQNAPFYLAVDEQDLFWTNHAGPGQSVMRLALDTGEAVDFATNQFNPTYVACNDQAVYWTNLKGGGGTVMCKPRAGGSMKVLAQGQLGPSALAIDTDRVYWTSLDLANVTPQGLASRSMILSVPIAGGQPEVLVEQKGHFWGLAVDDGAVYWTSFDGGLVSKIPKPGLK